MSDENAKTSQSPLGNIRKKHHMLTPRQSERNLGIGEASMSLGKAPKSTRFQIGGIGGSNQSDQIFFNSQNIIRNYLKVDFFFFWFTVNWFRKEYGKTDSTDSHESSESPTEASFIRQPSLHHIHHRSTARGGRG